MVTPLVLRLLTLKGSNSTAMSRMGGDAGEDVSQPGLRIFQWKFNAPPTPQDAQW
jgi:hypothetical protein